jgi:hypothetical protein
MPYIKQVAEWIDNVGLVYYYVVIKNGMQLARFSEWEDAEDYLKEKVNA